MGIAALAIFIAVTVVFNTLLKRYLRISRRSAHLYRSAGRHPSTNTTVGIRQGG